MCIKLIEAVEAQASEIERLRSIIDKPLEELRAQEIEKQAARIQELEGTVVALREIAVSERASALFNGPWDGGLPVEATYEQIMEKAAKDALSQLQAKHPEAFG